MKKFFFLTGFYIITSFTSAQELTKDVHKAVAQVVLSDSVWYSFTDSRISFGTGFFIDQQTLVTSYHVLFSLLSIASDSSSFKDLLDSSYIEKEGQRYSIKGIRHISAKDDLAVLQVEGYEGPVLRLAEEEPENSIKILGFPSVDRTLEHGVSVHLRETTGEVFSQNNPFFCSVDDIPLMIDFFGNFRGASGSPVLNNKGKVIGILHIYGPGGHSCATKVKYLKELLESPSIKNEDMYHSIQTEIVNDLNQAITGDQNAQYAMGILLWQDLIPEGLQTSGGYILDMENMEELAIILFTALAERGYAAAQNILGRIEYYRNSTNDEFVSEDSEGFQKGWEWTKKAADQGLMFSQYEISYSVEDEEERMKYLKQAADQNYIPAQYALYKELKNRSFLEIEDDYTNLDSTPDEFETLQKIMNVQCTWLKNIKTLADRGYPPAQFDLAKYADRITQSGKDNYIYSAVSLYERAGDQGHGLAQLRIGQLYYYGYKNIIEPNEEKSSYWLLRARQNGIFTPFNDDLALMTILRSNPEDSFTEKAFKFAGRIGIYFSQIFENDEYGGNYEEDDLEPHTSVMMMLSVEEIEDYHSILDQKQKAELMEAAIDQLDQCLSSLHI
ncbi:MAG: bifunctional trypsin-like peptidase domain-containing/SEL1-like repeat protein [Bdellovibrionales bacterium]|nr:bifunctional trypsin-like peptidase domain-containing/SEL1-like repeat protein [Bdellovibrionales bacterium]